MKRTAFEEFAIAISGMLKSPVSGLLPDDWFITIGPVQDRSMFRSWYFAGYSADKLLEKLCGLGYERRDNNDVAILRLQNVQRRLSTFREGART